MVRKGNQQRNGLDRNSSNHKTSISESGGGSLKEKKERQKAREGKVVDGEELPNGTQPNSSLAETNKTKYVRDEKRSNKKSGNFPIKAKPVVDRVSDLAQPVSVSSNSRDPVADESSLNTPDLREQNETSPGSNHSLKSPKRSSGCLQHGLPVKDVMEASGSSDAVAGRSLRASALSILKVASTWLERQKPFFTTLTTIVVDACNNVRHKTEQATTIIVDACNYVGLKTEQAYPIVWEWLVHFGKLMMLISVVWLDCSIRGLDSFIRMGTTSFFTVIWCSILSLIAMIGFSKFLMIMAIAAIVAVFVGFTLAILVIVIFAIMFLWLYGSFWTTGLVIVVGGSAFALHLERFALLVTTIYSVYCAKTYVGWLGLLLGLNLSFISSDCLIYFLNRRRPNRPPEQMDGSHGQSDFFNGEPSHASPFETAAGRSTDRSPGVPSTSGDDVELTSEDEVVRLLNCTDHYSALGFSRYENVDISLLKREYRKKAMLVHPDKNMGNEKAAEAFKKLQNAYEVLLDSLKRKAYDDELRREELLNCFRRLQNISQKNGRHGLFSSGFTHYEAETEDARGDSRRITCKKCGNFHIWVYTNKSKSQARWCQDCKDFHPAKDGDGWVEQSLHPFFFGLLQKVEAPSAYVCAESRIYNATEWFICQGMNCPANTHKPSFHVNTNVTSKHSSTKGTSWGQRASGMPTSNMEENMTEEEFYEWLQNAVQLGFFEANGGSPSTESPSPSTGNCSKSGGSGSSKRKKKGKKQW